MRDDSNHISLITKIRAMEGKLLTDIDYNNMHNMNSILEIYTYLHEKEEYTAIFDAHEDIVELHRYDLEHLLVHSLYENIIKIYKFATRQERKFLDIIITRFEIDILKKCIANLENEKKINHVVTYGDFFRKHSNIEFSEMYKATDMQQFVMNLRNSKYNTVFKELLNREYSKLSDYENALDVFYFLNIWNSKNRFNSDTEKIITHIVGTEIDLYNIKTIYRCKKYYKMQPSRIKNYIVLVGYKLKMQQLDALVEAEDVAEFIRIYESTYYSNLDISFEIKNINASFERTLNNIHMNFIKKNPNSLARVYTYFDKKSYEIHYITRIIENIRYKK